LALILTIYVTISRAAFPDSLVSVLSRSKVPESAIGLAIHSIEGNQADVSHNASTSFNPASVMKLLTTLSALDTLGPAYTWRTRVLVAGEISEGILHGDLIIQGGGDPGLNSERFWGLIRDIRARGIREIHGDVLIDNGFYAIDPVDPGEFDQSPLKPYNAHPAALLINYNAMWLTLEARGQALNARLDPAGWPLDVSARPYNVATCDDWRDTIDIQRAEDRLVVAGQYPTGCGLSGVWVNVLCPAATSATYFKTFWNESGGILTGQMRLGATPAEARLLVERESLPLSLIARDINKFSNNVMAKMLFLNLGAARYGAPATWEKGQAAMHAWLAEKGLSIPELVVENGSGLSRIERLSPASVAMLLAWAARQPLYYDFAASLPALGQDGTQKRRKNGTPLAGRAWLKSGTLNGVRNLAGYYLDAAGRRKLIVLFIAHPNATQAVAAQDAIIDWALTSQ
jgi:D-alanyl-D-alanine carboxypeptidase/D-alanyl-D-alanine-endopeptidase (penicillin-binding protein 4)